MQNDPQLLQMQQTIKDAKTARSEISRKIQLLQKMGENVGTLPTELSNLDQRIAKIANVLKEEGYST